MDAGPVLPRLLITRRIPAAGLARLQGRVRYTILREDGVPSREEIRAAAGAGGGVDGILSLLTEKIDAAVMDASPRLRVVANMAVGFDNVDVAAATARGIVVTNTPGVLTQTTADFTWALLLAAARRVPEADRFVRDGRWKTWEPEGLLGQDVWGRTLGIIGFGRIGAAVAGRAAGFDMKVLYHDPFPPGPDAVKAAEKVGAVAVSLEELLGRADFISVHAPLTARTHHLIGDAELELVKPTAVLVNTARGPIVDPAALYRALTRGRLWAAALDVFETEPPPRDEPLLSLPNVVVAPHLGSASYETRDRMAVLAAEGAATVLEGGRPAHPVNPEVLERGGRAPGSRFDRGGR
jgi:glyoxylate reductase